MMELFPVPAEETKADVNNNGSGNSGNGKPEKYSLRPRSLRQKTEKGLELKKEILSQRNRKNPDNGKPKLKPPPLSKYRRKTANARERNRMREINVAFETLRRAVPHISGSLTSGNEKLTKITTLRLAMKYIQALRQVLDRTSPPAAATTVATTSAASSADSPLTLAAATTFLDDDANLDALLSDGESLNFNSDMSECFASPEHPLTSPLSEFSVSDHSPDFCGSPELPFGENSVISGRDFCLGGDLTDSDFCREFLNGHCFDVLS